MNTQNKKQIVSLLNSCEYRKVLELCSKLRNADEVYFYALALDQIASINKHKGNKYLRLLNESLTFIQQGKKRYPDDNKFEFLLGLNHLHAQRGKEALLIFKNLYNKTKDLKYLISVANAQKATGLYEDALRNYKKTSSLGSSKLLVLHNVANTYLKMGNKEQTRAIAKQGLEIKPENAFESQIREDLEKLAKE